MKKLCLVLSLGFIILCFVSPSQSKAGDDFVENVLKAKAELKSGVNIFDDAIIKKAKDKFLKDYQRVLMSTKISPRNLPANNP